VLKSVSPRTLLIYPTKIPSREGKYQRSFVFSLRAGLPKDPPTNSLRSSFPIHNWSLDTRLVPPGNARETLLVLGLTQFFLEVWSATVPEGPRNRNVFGPANTKSFFFPSKFPRPCQHSEPPARSCGVSGHHTLPHT